MLRCKRRRCNWSKIQKEADAGTQLAVEKFAAEVAKGEAEECLLREEISAREHTLNLLLGRLPQAIVRKSKDFAALPLPSAEGALAVERLLARADVVQAEHELAAAKWDVETARKEFLPQLNVSAALGVNAFNPKYLVRLPESLVWNAVGNLTAPLINKRAIRAQFAQADAQQRTRFTTMRRRFWRLSWRRTLRSPNWSIWLWWRVTNVNNMLRCRVRCRLRNSCMRTTVLLILK